MILYRSRFIQLYRVLYQTNYSLVPSMVTCEKHHLLPDIESLDSSALLFIANHITARRMLVACSWQEDIANKQNEMKNEMKKSLEDPLLANIRI
jgi:hypothetical protein